MSDLFFADAAAFIRRNGLAPLTAGEQVLWITLALFANANGEAWPSLSELSRMLGRPIRSIQLSRASLVRQGFLRKIHTDDRATATYAVLMPGE